MVEGNFHTNARTAPRCAFDLEMTTHGLSALSHIEQAEVTADGTLLRPESLAIIADAEPDFVHSILQVRSNDVRATMLHCI